ncbi:MAG: hypothetical protein ACLS5K_02160 [Streptococcus salivarius]
MRRFSVGGLPAGGSLDIDEGDAPKGNLLTALYLWFQVFSNLSLTLAARDYQGIVAIMRCGLSAATSPMYVILNAQEMVSSSSCQS